MALVNKQDSNFTELRYAVEDTPGHVPSDAVWHPLEPNSYKSFGASVKTKTRMPINSTRQLNKPVVVDIDAGGGFQQDLTADNSADLAQSFMFAVLRTKDELNVATVDGSGNAYTVTSGGTGYYAGDLLFAKGTFAQAANEGLKTVSGLSTATSVAVTDTGLVTESGAAGIISRVGFEFPAGTVTVDVSGTYPKLVVTAVAASSTFTITSTDNFLDTETVTLGGVVYTAQDTFTAAAGHFKIGADKAASLVNLARAINQSGTGAGTLYDAVNTDPNPYATATEASPLVATARVAGAVGNAITTTETVTSGSWTSGVFSGGSGGRALNSFGLIPGEFIYVGDDTTTKSFFHAANNGFMRIRSIAAGYIEVDKAQFTMVTDDGTVDGLGGAGNTIRIYFGRVLKNESERSLIVIRGLQIERTLGAPDDSDLDAVQSEYLVRAVANELKIDFKTADIVRLELDFMANTSELRSASDGLKPGTRPSLEDTDAFNTTSDVSVTKLAIVTAGDECPTPLFSFFTDLVLDIKNNVKQNKAVKVLGAFDSTPGFFQVSATVTAYFTDIAEMQAVIDNESVTVETHLVKFNKGVSIDIPLVVLSDALADVKLNEPIMIPLKSDAARSRAVNPNTDHTLLWVFWDYLPDVAA